VSVAVTDATERIGADFARELDHRLSSLPKRFALDARSGENDVAAVLDAARGADALLLLLYLRPMSGRGVIALPAAAALVAERLAAAGVRVVTVSFGSPYVLRGLPRARTELLGYGSQKGAQIAVARALFGEAAVGGRLPVTIPGVAERGAGIERPGHP